MFLRFPVLLCLVLMSHHALAIPLGYRYVGSRVVSEGRHVYWYWNADYYQVDSAGAGFFARLYARNVEKKEGRDYVPFISWGSRNFRRMDCKEPYEAIGESEPLHTGGGAGWHGRSPVLPACP